MKNSAYTSIGRIKNRMIDKRAIIYCWSDSERIPFEPEIGDLIICADIGTEYARKSGVEPAVIIGDFDSAEKPSASSEYEIISLPREKDDTDALFAARYALERGYRRIYLAGGLGGRLDHTLGAIAVLRFIEKNGAECIISDGRTRVSLVRSLCVKLFPYTGNVKYISVFPSGDRSDGVFINGFKYNLDNYDLNSEFPIGVSNEPVKGQDGIIKAGKGDILVVEILY